MIIKDFILKPLKNYLYLLIPICCIIFWAALSIISNNFIIQGYDYGGFYDAFRSILHNITNLYSMETSNYRYLPSFAIVFSFLGLFSYSTSCWIFYFISIIFGILSVIEFNKICKLLNISKKLDRFLFLIIISNGYRILKLFDALQSKFILLFLILLFLRREIELRSQKKDRDDIKFFFVQIMILIFAVGIFPAFIFLIPIYIFSNISFKELFSKVQLEKYTTTIIAFFIQNFIFLVYPSLIFNLLNASTLGNPSLFENMPISITYGLIKNSPNGFDYIPTDGFTCLYYVFINKKFNYSFFLILVIAIFAFILTVNKNLTIEEKFGYHSFLILFFSLYMTNITFIAILPPIVILFIGKFNQNYKGIKEFIRKNLFIIIGSLSISFIYFYPNLYFLLVRFPFITTIPIELFILLFPALYAFILFCAVVIRKNYISMLFEKPIIREILKFCIVGALGTLVNVVVLFFLVEIVFGHAYIILCEIVAFIIASINNYLLNKTWTFKEDIKDQLKRKYIIFLLTSILALVVNLSILNYLIENTNLWYIFAEVIAITVAFIVNFLISKFLTFRKRLHKITENKIKEDSLHKEPMNTLIFLPTYNEQGNIGKIIEEIEALSIDKDILIVDDNSTDGTLDIIEKKKKKYSNIILILRLGEKGRGLAGIEAFKYFSNSEYDVLVELDADLSHQPKYIPEFLKLFPNYDLIIGSRLVEHGREVGRGIIRFIITLLSNLIIKLLYRVRIKDATSGFRAFKKELVLRLDLDHFISKHYSITEEILYGCILANAKVKEIPIIFNQRAMGYSKLSVKKTIYTGIGIIRILLRGKKILKH